MIHETAPGTGRQARDHPGRVIGRSVRRVLWYLCIVLAGIVAAKLGLIEKLFPGGGK